MFGISQSNDITSHQQNELMTTEAVINRLSSKSKIANNATFKTEDYPETSSARILEKYSPRVPILIWSIDQKINIKKRKFIVPKDITLGQFLFVVRKQVINVNSADGLFIFVSDQNVMLPCGELIGNIYENYKSNGFLKLTLTKENTFG